MTHILEFMVSACFVAIFALVILLVVLRYVFNSSITGANELITVLFVYNNRGLYLTGVQQSVVRL